MNSVGTGSVDLPQDGGSTGFVSPSSPIHPGAPTHGPVLHPPAYLRKPLWIHDLLARGDSLPDLCAPVS
ncbi:MAG: hypothetical protein EA421_02195 [Gemmatimonadales bacterium]|nr:MAG: hypothetical protein EA421_02195 [Gemmatimonadales bacterium]